MFLVGEARVDEQIASERFACDVERCKGACCTLSGGRGAPLDDDELIELERAFPVIKKHLSQRHLQIIQQYGLYEGTPGNMTTTCVENKACVFVFYDEGIARCSLERAFLNGERSWRKPMSCHLFPVRISRIFSETLRYEMIRECSPARVCGQEKQIPLYDFLEDALVRRFGKEWFERFRKECRHQDPHIGAGPAAPTPMK